MDSPEVLAFFIEKNRQISLLAFKTPNSSVTQMLADTTVWLQNITDTYYKRLKCCIGSCNQKYTRLELLDLISNTFYSASQPLGQVKLVCAFNGAVFESPINPRFFMSYITKKDDAETILKETMLATSVPIADGIIELVWR